MTTEALTLPVRIGNALWNYGLYLGRTAWPFNLAGFYPLQRVPVAWSVGVCVALVLTTLLVLHERSRRPWLLVGWLWFAGTLLPVSGLIQFGGQAMADRYAFIPHIGLFIAITWEAADWMSRLTLPRELIAAFAAAVLAACAVVTSTQIGYWSDSITLFEHAVAVTSGSYFAHNNLGVALEAAGRKDEAAVHYAEAVRLNPTWPEAQNNYGIACAWRGDYAEAVQHFAEALRVRPDFVRAENNMGTALSFQGDLNGAMVHYLRAVELDPGYVEARYALADVFERRGQLDKAEEHYARVLAQRPGWPPAMERLERVRAARRASGAADGPAQ
jgi:tetratricopeptide (TPR) repeat protein